MSDDELEKLAAEMQNIKPSETSRERGLGAAMAAFDMEFATENAAQENSALEKSTQTTQGLGHAPRPTGNSTGEGLVQTFGRRAMTTLDKIFNMKPRTAMMGGTCMAAFIASFVVYQAVPGDRFVIPVTEPVAAVMAEDETARTETPADIDVAKPSIVDTPTLAVEPVLPVVPKTVIVPKTGDIETLETPSDVVVPKTDDIKTPDTSFDVAEVAPSNVVTIERRVLKSPARTAERAVPSVTKTETRRVRGDDGTFKTVTEAVVVQQASTELVTIPPVYETMRDTVMINADGSSEVLSSEPLSSPVASRSPSPVSETLGALSSDLVPSPPSAIAPMADLGASIGEDIVISGSRESKFSAKASRGGATADASTYDEIIVTGSKSKSRRSRSRGTKKSSPAFAPASPPPGNPMPITAPIEADKAPVRMVDRAIPAVTKTISRRVVKTPARTVERVVPAITKDVTVQVLAEDGSYKDVTKTFVIQEASTELVTIPATFETVSETVVVSEGRTEMVAIGADGKIIRPDPVVKPPKPTPQSGLLTAGDYDDVLNPDLYKVYLDKMLQGQLKGKDLPYVDADQRINIRVVDRLGKPVPLADITLTTSKRDKMFPLRTGADGMAYLYPNFDGLESGTRIKVSAKGGRTARTKLTRKLSRSGGDLVIELDIDAAPVEKLDLLLTIDATGSMSDEMRYLQSELKAIVERVEEAHPGIDIRTGLVVYRDVGDSYVVREVPFTDDIDEFRKALGAQSAGGGGDTPEAMHTAMQTGLQMDWREDALKVNLLVADAPPHDRHITETWEAGLLSRTRGIHMVPLAASGVDKTAEFLMRSMAQITGGRFLFLTDDSGIGNPHAKPTVDCYVVTRLDGLVTRVLSSLIKGDRVEPEAGEVIRSIGNYRSGTCAIESQEENTSPQTVSYEDKQ